MFVVLTSRHHRHAENFLSGVSETIFLENFVKPKYLMVAMTKKVCRNFCNFLDTKRWSPSFCELELPKNVNTSPFYKSYAHYFRISTFNSALFFSLLSSNRRFALEIGKHCPISRDRPIFAALP